MSIQDGNFQYPEGAPLPAHLLPRDPKIDPRPGDVLRKGHITRSVQVGASASDICVRCHECLKRADGHHCRTVMPFISQFRRWAAGADVLERAI